ncbi:Protein SMG7 [Tolypocladium capitatum]|uniref:Nonsense-mediated mRNA decay factor n=1 Tax=Tolypocladium capitatum TaxID=45235 RepID=A0A2K3QBC9_9HYPO|nr:Protein SMG7 [Tolypocladium capitatum]
MATATSQAGQAWQHALRIRKHLLKQLEKLQADSASGIDASQFEAVDGLLEKFRLGCVHTIFLDVEYAVKENTEDALWGLHTSINAEYRRILGRLRHSSHAVEKRKVEKMYNNFLRIAQKFYKGYIQRLSARYDVQELRRVAQGIDVEQMDAGDTISPVPAELSRMVLKSCHSTLLRLGDLARYRIQAKRKNTGYDTALTYYGLARHLMPESGFAFHQMGIVNLDQENHLDVVYHFYRAWAVDIPHPNAKSNLEAEFKSLQLAKGRPSPSAPHDAFTMWFVKLHARFYKGEAFSQQAELEGEVMHRLEMACRNASSGDTLLKMALINLSAHEIASAAFADTKTGSASRFWQFTLRFNCLFIMTLCKVLDSELQEAISNRAEDSSESAAVELTSATESLLPTLRTYCVWLAARRQELFSATHAFGSAVPTMVQNLAKVLTLLCVVTYNRGNLASCPYLLPEDLEVRGIRSLSGDRVPEACRVYCRDDGDSKPYLYDPGQRLDLVKENLARVLDVLRCAYFLAEDGPTPVSYQVVENWLVFEYQPDATSASPPNNTEAVLSSADGYLGSQRDAPAEDTPGRETRGTGPLPVSKQNGMDAVGLEAPDSAQAICQASADEDHAEQTVIAMLTPFLKPPTPQPQHHTRSPEESSYGMHTSTANEIFSSAPAYSTPTITRPSGPIAPFPWAWDGTPKPDGIQDSAASAGKEAFIRASRNNSPRESMAPGTTFDDPFITPGRNQPGVSPQTYHGPPVAGNLCSTPGFTAEKAHRDNLLQSLTSTGITRTSPFVHNGERQRAMEQSKGQAPPTWASQNFDQGPASTATTTFSHPSSLYQGTPADGIGLGVSAHGDAGRRRFQSPTHDVNGSSSSRRVQIGDSAVSYDEAIFRAAWVGK